MSAVGPRLLPIEYEWDKTEHLAIHRSPTYGKMDELEIVGRQLNLRVIATPGGKKGKLRLSGPLGMDGSRDHNAQLSIQKGIGDSGVGLWMLGEMHRVSEGFAH